MAVILLDNMVDKEKLSDIWRAQGLLRRRRYSRCIELCTRGLEKRPSDGQFFWLKARATVMEIREHYRLGKQGKPNGSGQTDLIHLSSLDLQKFVRIPSFAKSLLDYLLYSDQVKL